MKKVNICFIADSGYIIPTITAVTSLVMNKSNDTYYNIYIVTNDFSEKQKKLFKKLSSESVTIKIVEVDCEVKYKEIKSNNVHVTSTALYKFNLGNIFPYLDKILYLDGDVIAKKDLYEFFSIDLGECYAAAVKDYRAVVSNPNPLKYLQLSSNAYFNSGVMLLNLKKLRQDEMQQKLFNYRINGFNYFMDQDTLNVVFGDKVIYMPIYYNAMYSTLSHFTDKEICRYYELNSKESKEDIYNNSIIVHLCSPTKPWKCIDSWHADEWYWYYKHSPLKHVTLDRTYRNPPESRREHIEHIIIRSYICFRCQGLLALIKKGNKYICKILKELQ